MGEPTRDSRVRRRFCGLSLNGKDGVRGNGGLVMGACLWGRVYGGVFSELWTRILTSVTRYILSIYSRVNAYARTTDNRHNCIFIYFNVAIF